MGLKKLILTSFLLVSTTAAGCGGLGDRGAGATMGPNVTTPTPGGQATPSERRITPMPGARAASNATPSATSGYGRVVRSMRSEIPPSLHTMSLGFEDIVNPDADWAEVRSHLDATDINVLQLSAGRVEWTPFDWPAYPEVAADSGTDHLQRAIDELRVAPDGSKRQIDLMIDAFIPAWIAQEPAIAGRGIDGEAAAYVPSASALYHGPVGERIVEYAGELARRYQPDQITLTEFMFDDETFGDDDFELFKAMTGALDWPRNESGAIDTESPAIGEWRARVLADLLGRVRAEVKQVERDNGKTILAGTDVVVDWERPERGRPDVGNDYELLGRSVDRMTLWAYLGTEGRLPDDVRRLTAALSSSGLDMSRFAVSIGLWGSNDSTVDTVSAETLAQAVRAAETNGVSVVNVTPMSLMTAAHWQALAEVWPRA